MILTVQQKTNSNGNARQLQIDFENKTYKRGYYINGFCDVRKLPAAALDELERWVKNNNFKKLED